MLSYTAQFEIEPESVVQAEGLEAVFECLCRRLLSHLWIVNEIPSSSDLFPREIQITRGTSGNPSVLTIPASSQFNNSVVQCLALSLSGRVFSRNVTLTVGELYIIIYIISLDFLQFSEQVAVQVENGEHIVTILVVNNFTTNLKYQVCVTQTTLEQDSTETYVLAMIGANKEFNFNYTNHSVCDIFSFIVIPTAMEIEGRPSEPVTGFFTTATGTVSACFSECLST